jgi:glycosyltransferase involved in cell wall biosynthesis
MIVFAVVKIITSFNKIFIPNKSKKNKQPTVLYLSLFPKDNAGYYYRTKLWVDKLRENNIKSNAKTLMNNKHLKNLTNGNKNELIRQIYIRFFQCLSAYKYDIIIIRRTLLPFNDYGNLFLEKLILSMRKTVVLDFDDDMTNYKKKSNSKSLYGKFLLENHDKFKSSLLLFDYFIVGSSYLKNLVLEHNPKIKNSNICIIPTCVDYNKYKPKSYVSTTHPFRIGWVGTKGNQKYIDTVIPVLNKLCEKYNFELIVFSDKNYTNEAAIFKIINKVWNKETELKTIKEFDIGIMPLFHNNTTKGKCGFKLIQYMGIGIISIAEKIGANIDIIPNNNYGFLCSNSDEWEKAFIEIFEMDIKTLSTFGNNARNWITKNYTFDGNENKFLSFINYLNK